MKFLEEFVEKIRNAIEAKGMSIENFYQSFDEDQSDKIELDEFF